MLVETEVAEPVADHVALMVSELASNAVLHARTPYSVTASRDGDLVRVEVRDGSSLMPHVRQYSLEAPDGSGAADRRLAGDPVGCRAGRRRRGEDGVVRGRRGSGVVSPVVEVRVLGLPVRIHEATSEHGDALRREFALMREASPDADEVPQRLHALIEQLSERFSGFNDEAEERLRVAVERGEPTVDLTFRVPAEARRRRASSSTPCSTTPRSSAAAGRTCSRSSRHPRSSPTGGGSSGSS